MSFIEAIFVGIYPYLCGPILSASLCLPVFPFLSLSPFLPSICVFVCACGVQLCMASRAPNEMIFNGCFVLRELTRRARDLCVWRPEPMPMHLDGNSAMGFAPPTAAKVPRREKVFVSVHLVGRSVGRSIFRSK